MNQLNGSTGKSILIVDDEDDLREALAFDFQRQKYIVTEASNGKIAMDLVIQSQPDIILTDSRMPGGDGIELLNNVKLNFPLIPVIISTGFTEIGIDKAYDFGASNVIFKPFDRKYLKSVVEKALMSVEEKCHQFIKDSGYFFEANPMEIFLTESDSGSDLKFGKIGFSFFFEKSKIKEKNFLKINMQTKEFKDLTFYGIVSFVANHDSFPQKQRIGIEILNVEGQLKSEFLYFIFKNKTVSTIPS